MCSKHFNIVVFCCLLWFLVWCVVGFMGEGREGRSEGNLLWLFVVRTGLSCSLCGLYWLFLFVSNFL